MKISNGLVTLCAWGVANHGDGLVDAQLVAEFADHILVVGKDHDRLASVQEVVDEFSSGIYLAHPCFFHDLGQALKGQQCIRICRQCISVKFLFALVCWQIKRNQRHLRVLVVLEHILLLSAHHMGLHERLEFGNVAGA